MTVRHTQKEDEEEEAVIIRWQLLKLQETDHELAETKYKGKVHGILNASSKICSLVVNGQSFLVTDGSLLNLFWFLLLP
jgi:hypothetical protein